MSKRVSVLFALVGVTALGVGMVIAQGQGGAGAGRVPGAQTTPEEFNRRMLEFRERMLDQLQMSQAEKSAALEAVKAKSDARTKLSEKLNALREASEDQKTTDADIAKALNEFIASQVEYNRALSTADNALVKRVTLRSRAKLTVAGYIENGVGFGGGGGAFFGGGRRGSGPEGFPRPEGGRRPEGKGQRPNP